MGIDDETIVIEILAGSYIAFDSPNEFRDIADKIFFITLNLSDLYIFKQFIYNYL